MPAVGPLLLQPYCSKLIYGGLNNGKAHGSTPPGGVSEATELDRGAEQASGLETVYGAGGGNGD